MPGGLHADLAAGADGFVGVEHEVNDDVLNLLGIELDFRQRFEIGGEFNLCRGLPPAESGGDYFVQIGSHGFEFRFLAQDAQPADEVVHVVDGFGNAAQHIGAKFRVVKMQRQVLQHQRQRGGGVFQIVREEGGHGAERLLFVRLHEFSRELDGEQARADVAADAAQQVQFFL